MNQTKQLLLWTVAMAFGSAALSLSSWSSAMMPIAVPHDGIVKLSLVLSDFLPC